MANHQDHPFVQLMNKSELTYEQIKSLPLTLPPIIPQDLSGKVAVVTGANVGIGYEAAKAIASMKPKLLILACRNAGKANEAKAKIEEETKFTNIEIATLDLASFASTKSFAKSFLARNLPLDIFVSNAGIAGQGWNVTDDGHEIIMQVNHLANVLLTLMLTPALKKASSARVVIVASDVHFWCPPNRPDPQDPAPVKALLSNPEQAGFVGQYTGSKLMNVLFAKEYARRCPHKNISICTANPGYTKSELAAKDPKTGEANGAQRHDLLVQRETYEGAKTIIDCAINPKIVNGEYYSDMEVSRTRSSVQGEAGSQFAQRAWKDTMNILEKEVESGSIESWAN